MRALALALALAAPAGAASPVDKAAARLAAALLERLPERGASVAVLTFEDSTGRPVELGRLLADALSSELLKSGKVQVQDRAYLARLLGEMTLGQAGLTDSKNALQVGRMSAAKYLVVGRIDAAGRRAMLDARLIAAETATMAASAREEMKLPSELADLLAKPAATDAGTALFDRERLDQDAVFLERPGADGCRWVEARADAPAGRTADEGRAAALSLARRKAAARLTGADPGPAPDFTESAFSGQLEGVLRATRPSRVIAETVTGEDRKGGRHRLTLETCLKPVKGGGGLTVELMLNQARFSEGQEARAVVSVSRDARVFLYSADFAGRVSRVFPSGAASDNRVAAGRPLSFPDEAQRAAGIRLKAELPAGRTSSVEVLRALAVEGDPGALLEGRSEWAALVAALEDAGLPWAEDARVFTVYGR